MITLKELNPKGFPLTKEQEANLIEHHRIMNLVRSKYGKPMICTSGVRDLADHKRIYMDKAKALGLSNVRIPMGSKHLKACASDWLDRDGSFMKWCRENESWLASINVWVEDDSSVPRVHLQTEPYGSWAPGKSIFFKP
jgi:hypothetical protein